MGNSLEQQHDMIIDTASILFRAFAVNNNTQFLQSGVNAAEVSVGMAMHMALNSLTATIQKIQPDQLIFTFEGTQNWRKKFTSEEGRVSDLKYKANRQPPKNVEVLIEMLTSFKELVEKYTTALSLQHPILEGDDLISGYVQHATAAGRRVTIFTGDGDMTQLLKFPGTRVFNPTTKDFVECEDPNYFIFEKCIRGDSGDNVASAYPRVRVDKIKLAFTDDFHRANMMNHVWKVKDPEDKTVILKEVNVGEAFAENQILMDLTMQPDYVKQVIMETVETECQKMGQKTFNYLHFVRFLHKYNLKKILESVGRYAEVFSMNNFRR